MDSSVEQNVQLVIITLNNLNRSYYTYWRADCKSKVTDSPTGKQTLNCGTILNALNGILMFIYLFVLFIYLRQR